MDEFAQHMKLHYIGLQLTLIQKEINQLNRSHKELMEKQRGTYSPNEQKYHQDLETCLDHISNQMTQLQLAIEL